MVPQLLVVAVSLFAFAMVIKSQDFRLDAPKEGSDFEGPTSNWRRPFTKQAECLYLSLLSKSAI